MGVVVPRPSMKAIEIRPSKSFNGAWVAFEARFEAVAICFFLVATSSARAEEEVSPLKAGLREEVELLVTCELKETPKAGEIGVLESRAEREAARGIYHYKLWLPHGYLAQPQRRWPCIFVASPIGNAQMGNMAKRLRAGRYFVVMLVESRNGPWAPSIGNFLAAHDDVVKRIRLKEGAKIATGLSGGARASSVFVQLRPGFAGAILQGAGVARDEGGRFYFSGAARNRPLSIAMLIGRAESPPKRSPGNARCPWVGSTRCLPNQRRPRMGAPRDFRKSARLD